MAAGLVRGGDHHLRHDDLRRQLAARPAAPGVKDKRGLATSPWGRLRPPLGPPFGLPSLGEPGQCRPTTVFLVETTIKTSLGPAKQLPLLHCQHLEAQEVFTKIKLTPKGVIQLH